MKRAMLGCLLTLVGLGAARTVQAQTDPWLVLASGSDVITDDNGIVTCFNGTTTETGVGNCNSAFSWGVSTAGSSGSNIILTATTFDGWNITQNTGNTQAPSCTPWCDDQTQIDVTGGSSNLVSYFGAASFANVPGVQDTQAVSINTGGFTSTGYYTQPSKALTNLGYSDGAVPDLSSWTAIGGSTMTFASGSITPQSTGSVLGSGSFALTNMMDFTAGGDYSVTDTITAVPEPASLILLGSTLLGASIIVRKKTHSRRSEKA